MASRDPDLFSLSQAEIPLRLLAEQGWIPLRLMGPLLGYKNERSIYGRQRGLKPIETVRIGGIERVYEDTVIRELKRVPRELQEHAKILLSYYETAKVVYNRNQELDKEFSDA